MEKVKKILMEVAKIGGWLVALVQFLVDTIPSAN